MTVEEFIKTICKGCEHPTECEYCRQSTKSDLREVIEGLLPDKGVYSAKDVIDYIHKKLEEELGGGE